MTLEELISEIRPSDPEAGEAAVAAAEAARKFLRDMELDM